MHTWKQAGNARLAVLVRNSLFWQPGSMDMLASQLEADKLEGELKLLRAPIWYRSQLPIHFTLQFRGFTMDSDVQWQCSLRVDLDT